MPQAKPNMETLFAETGATITPTPSKISNGHIPDTVAESRFANWAQLRADQFLAHLNEYGIPHWDNVTTYPAGAWSRSPTDDKVYESIQLVPSGLADPSGNTAYWTPFNAEAFVPIAGNGGNPMTGNLDGSNGTTINGFESLRLGDASTDQFTQVLWRSNSNHTDWSSRIQRGSSENANLVIENKGTGDISFISGGDFSFNDSRLKTIADPLSEKDAVNLRTLIGKTGKLLSSVTMDNSTTVVVIDIPASADDYDFLEVWSVNGRISADSNIGYTLASTSSPSSYYTFLNGGSRDSFLISSTEYTGGRVFTQKLTLYRTNDIISPVYNESFVSSVNVTTLQASSKQGYYADNIAGVFNSIVEMDAFYGWDTGSSTYSGKRIAIRSEVGLFNNGDFYLIGRNRIQ